MASDEVREGIRSAPGGPGPQGTDDQAPASGPRVGLRLLDDRRRFAARRLRRQQQRDARHRQPAVPERRSPSWAARSRVSSRRRSRTWTRSRSTTRAASSSSSQVCEYLIDLDNKNGLKPSLAESWDGQRATRPCGPSSCAKASRSTTAAPSRPRTSWRASERVVDPESGSGALAALAGILSPGGTKAVDAATVEFTLDKPFADFPYLVCQSSYNTVMLPRTYSGNFVNKPVGTGPFVLKSYNAKQKAVMSRTLPTGARTPPAVSFRTSIRSPGPWSRTSRPPTCSCSPAPSTSSRRRCSRARRRSSPIPTCAWTSTPARASARSRSTWSKEPVEERSPRSSARPSPTASTAIPSTRRSTTAVASSAPTPSGSRRCSRAARHRRAPAGLRQGQAAAHDRGLRQRQCRAPHSYRAAYSVRGPADLPVVGANPAGPSPGFGGSGGQ